jgi:SAM-dependent methyltransferase
VGYVDLDPRLFPADPEFLLLDLGPGSGFLAEHYAHDRRVVAVELDEELARAVAERPAPFQLSSCCGDAHRLPVRDASVDGVIALEVLEHVDDPGRVLAEAARVLKPEGALCLAVPTSYTEAVYSFLHPRYLRNATHVRIFKKRVLLETIERHGFVVDHVDPEHLEAALGWVAHAALRSDALPTGYALEHRWVEPKVDRMVAWVARTHVVCRVLPWARRRFGKSWYVYARKARATRVAA